MCMRGENQAVKFLSISMKHYPTYNIMVVVAMITDQPYMEKVFVNTHKVVTLSSSELLMTSQTIKVHIQQFTSK